MGQEGYNGYPVTIRTNGLIITRTYLNPDESGRDDPCLEVVQIDPDPVLDKSKKSGQYTQSVQIALPRQNVQWYSARDMRADPDNMTKSDKYQEWCCALYSGISG